VNDVSVVRERPGVPGLEPIRTPSRPTPFPSDTWRLFGCRRAGNSECSGDRAHARTQAVMSHFIHQLLNSALRREASRWQQMPLCGGGGRPLRTPRAARRRTRTGDSCQRRSREEAKRSPASSGESRVEASRARIAPLRSPIIGAPRTRTHCCRRGRDDPSRSSRGCHEHDEGVVGDLQLP
jgi:hypothetical protein